MNIVGRSKLWYGISLSILVPGAIALVLFGLRLGIDFTGGAVLQIKGDSTREKVQEIAAGAGYEKAIVSSMGEQLFQVRYVEGEQNLEQIVKTKGFRVEQFDRVGPSVSRDLIKSALISLAAVSLSIILFLGYAFRKVENPFRYGVIAIVALLHDSLFVLGIFAILGKVAGVEVDSFFVTAILTVIGFSVHDTIVVFDRIRENVGRLNGKFGDIVNTSINEVMVRSLNTSIVVVLVLLALLLFGGSSTRNFILALLLGMISGTYSSIFTAAPLLVTWHERKSFTQK